MRGKRTLWAIGAAVVTLGVAGTRAVAGPTVFGTLCNFDVVNNTGGNCNGFEIELDGVSPADITYTFGAPYNRYGTPHIRSSGGNTYVDYEATFSGGTWSTYTPSTTAPIVTGGHQFWTGGDPNYPLKNGGVPGDHFGLGLAGTVTPTKTVYRWMVGDNAGNLTPLGTNLLLPAPVITAAAPVANPAAPAAVQVVIAAPEDPQAFIQPALWVHVFTTETSSDPVALEDLVVGNNKVSETEAEWVLVQQGLGNFDSGLSDLNPGGQGVTVRYEFFKYTGTYDEQGIANTDVYDPALVGDYIGGQIGALNLAALPVDVPEPASLALLGLGALGLIGRRRSRR